MLKILKFTESRLKKLNISYDTKLSPQYLVDCDISNHACGSGWPMNALGMFFLNSNIFFMNLIIFFRLDS